MIKISRSIKLYCTRTKYMVGSISIIITFYCCEDTIIENNIVDYGIVINEINYNSSDSFNPDDWVEIYNNSNDIIDLSLWLLKDENDDHIFTIPSNTMILPNQYIIFCQDTIRFTEHFPNVDYYYGDLGFGLSGGSDHIRLFDPAGSLVDYVEYDDDSPWPTTPDGDGPTLELKHPSLDNANWESWAPSQGFGTPGAINSAHNGDI